MFATKTKRLPQRLWGGLCIAGPRGAAEAGGVLSGAVGAVGTERCSVGIVQSERLRVFRQSLGFQLVLFFPSPSSPNVNFSFTDLTPSILQLLGPLAALLAPLSYAVRGMEWAYSRTAQQHRAAIAALLSAHVPHPPGAALGLPEGGSATAPVQLQCSPAQLSTADSSPCARLPSASCSPARPVFLMQDQIWGPDQLPRSEWMFRNNAL